MKGALLLNDYFYFVDTLNTFCWNFYLNYVLNAGLLFVMQYSTLHCGIAEHCIRVTSYFH